LTICEPSIPTRLSCFKKPIELGRRSSGSLARPRLAHGRCLARRLIEAGTLQGFPYDCISRKNSPIPDYRKALHSRHQQTQTSAQTLASTVSRSVVGSLVQKLTLGGQCDFSLDARLLPLRVFLYFALPNAGVRYPSDGNLAAISGVSADQVWDSLQGRTAAPTIGRSPWCSLPGWRAGCRRGRGSMLNSGNL
jgi:hypothetical protein